MIAGTYHAKSSSKSILISCQAVRRFLLCSYSSRLPHETKSQHLRVEVTDTFVDVGIYRVIRLGEIPGGKKGVTNMLHVVLADRIGKYRKQIFNTET